jgi:hypothetical protein
MWLMMQGLGFHGGGKMKMIVTVVTCGAAVLLVSMSFATAAGRIHAR